MMSVACMMHLGSSPWLRARMAACSRERLRVLLQWGGKGWGAARETWATSCPPTAPKTPIGAAGTTDRSERVAQPGPNQDGRPFLPVL